MQSFGTSLPDSEALVNSRVGAVISLLDDVNTYVAFRSSLEKEFGRKLSEGTAKARAQALRSGVERGGDTSSLQTAYLKILEAIDWDARHHTSLCTSLNKEVVEPLTNNSTRLEGIRKKQHHFTSKLLAERDRTVGDYEKSKQKYFDSCDALELARQKKGLTKDEKSAEKAAKSFDLAQVDMLVAKNQFLLDTDLANVARTRLYNLDLPALHDDFQLVEAAAVRQLVDLLAKFSVLCEDTFERRQEALVMADKARASISVEEDQRKFIEIHSSAKLAAWALPRDVEFEECPVWHDVGEMSTTPSSVNFLQNVKIKASTRLATITPAIESKKREIAGLRNLRDAYEKDRTLGDATSVLENLMEAVRINTILEIEQTELKAQIDLINVTLPDEGPISLRLHDLKSTSFVTPTTCVVCSSSVWGKGLVCKQCGVALHSKCELKIPAGCGSAARAEVKTGRPSIDTIFSTGSRSPPPISPIGGSFSPGVERKVPPVFGVPPRNVVVVESSSSPVVQVQRSAVVMYNYEAATAFELTVQEGDAVTVVEDEDEGGWSKIQTLDGRRGQVPTSYLQINEEPAESPIVDSSTRQVQALYDYTAQSEEELSCVEGEIFDLSVVGMEFGEGWVEVTKDGRIGLIPATYVELVLV